MEKVEGSDTQVGFTPLNKSRMRAIYYRPDGQATGLLPADPQGQMYYFSKGFKGKVTQKDTISCPICEFEAKSAFGLQAHLKVHLKKEES